MREKRIPWRHGREGITLVELLVVMAILAILAGLSVPALLTFASSSSARDAAATELFTRLKYAQVHASSKRVETAVVYFLDNYESPQRNPNNTPSLESPIGETIRPVEQAPGFARVGVAFAAVEKITNGDVIALLESLPGFSGSADRLFTPVEGEPGQLFPIDPSACILFAEVYPTFTGAGQLPSDPYFYAPYYLSERPRYVPTQDLVDPGEIYVNRLNELGMDWVYVVFGLEDAADVFSGRLDVDLEDVLEIIPLPAHRFKHTGGLNVPSGAAERFSINLAAIPTAEPEIRESAFVVEALDGSQLSEVFLNHRELQLYKSTGRVRIAPNPEDAS
jgi:prepilin-type N-terminal cleavage/methylation domain-containing protein